MVKMSRWNYGKYVTSWHLNTRALPYYHMHAPVVVVVTARVVVVTTVHVVWVNAKRMGTCDC